MAKGCPSPVSTWEHLTIRIRTHITGTMATVIISTTPTWDDSAHGMIATATTGRVHNDSHGDYDSTVTVTPTAAMT